MLSTSAYYDWLAVRMNRMSGKRSIPKYQRIFDKSGRPAVWTASADAYKKRLHRILQACKEDDG